MYRLFIAAALPPEVKATLAGAQERLRRINPPVKWVAPAAMHLTLKFLGETSVELLPDIGAAMRAALAPRQAIALHLTTAGAFPNARRPNVIWSGVGGGTAALERAQADLEAALAGLGIPREDKPFRAHLTLGRVRREARPAEQERLGSAIGALPPLDMTPWTVDRIVLYRSDLRGGEPIYAQLDAVQL